MVSFAPFCFPASVCPLNVLMIMMGAVIYVLSEMSAVLQCCSAAGPVTSPGSVAPAGDRSASAANLKYFTLNAAIY